MNIMLEYFCHELPDRHNLLAWEATLYRGGEVFRHPEGFMHQLVAFEKNDFLPMVHVMVIGMN